MDIAQCRWYIPGQLKLLTKNPGSSRHRPQDPPLEAAGGDVAEGVTGRLGCKQECGELSPSLSAFCPSQTVTLCLSLW